MILAVYCSISYVYDMRSTRYYFTPCGSKATLWAIATSKYIMQSFIERDVICGRAKAYAQNPKDYNAGSRQNMFTL